MNLTQSLFHVRRLDNDAVLMRDVYPLTMLVGYQFTMRWTNAHVMYMRRRSPLTQRILRTVMSLPLNHPRFREDLVDKVYILLRV